MEDFDEVNTEKKTSDLEMVIEIKTASFAWDSPTPINAVLANGIIPYGSKSGTKTKISNAKDKAHVNGSLRLDKLERQISGKLFDSEDSACDRLNTPNSSDVDGTKVLHDINFTLKKVPPGKFYTRTFMS